MWCKEEVKKYWAPVLREGLQRALKDDVDKCHLRELKRGKGALSHLISQALLRKVILTLWWSLTCSLAAVKASKEEINPTKGWEKLESIMKLSDPIAKRIPGSYISLTLTLARGLKENQYRLPCDLLSVKSNSPKFGNVQQTRQEHAQTTCYAWCTPPSKSLTKQRLSELV